MFRVFPAVFARLFVTKQRRRNGRRLVHKVMNNGLEMLAKVRFFFWCTCLLSSSLWNISREKIFQVLEKSTGHSRDILLAFSCETCRLVALLVDGPPDFFAKQSSVEK